MNADAPPIAADQFVLGRAKLMMSRNRCILEIPS